MDIEKMDVEIPRKQEKVPTYWAFAIVATCFNPPLGLLALFFSWECGRTQRNGWKHSRIYSDVTFGLCVIAIVSTIIILVFVYADGGFADEHYYCREDVIAGKTGDDLRKDPSCPTPAPEVDDSAMTNTTTTATTTATITESPP